MLLEPQDSMDGFCLTVPGGSQGLQKPEDNSGGRLCCGLQTTGIKSELLLVFPQAEMVFDSP